MKADDLRTPVSGMRRCTHPFQRIALTTVLTGLTGLLGLFAAFSCSPTEENTIESEQSRSVRQLNSADALSEDGQGAGEQADDQANQRASTDSSADSGNTSSTTDASGNPSSDLDRPVGPIRKASTPLPSTTNTGVSSNTGKVDGMFEDELLRDGEIIEDSPLVALYQQGIEVYGDNCALCHQDYADSTKKPRTLDQIEWAIGVIPVMQSLSTLGELEKESLAFALSANPLEQIEADRALRLSQSRQLDQEASSDSTAMTGDVADPQNSSSSTNQMSSTGQTDASDAQQEAGNDQGQNQDPQPITIDPRLERGQQLFAQNCAPCHQSFSVTEKKPRSSEQIHQAIDDINVMAFLQTAASEVIEDIAYALNYQAPAQQDLADANDDNEGNENSDSDSTAGDGSAQPEEALPAYFQSSVRLGSIDYITSKAQTLFLASNNGSTIGGLIDRLRNNAPFFGGPCSPFEQDCEANNNAGLSVGLAIDSSPTRSGYVHQLCSESLANDQTVRHVLDRLDIASSTTPSQELIERVAQDFFPQHSLPEQSGPTLVNFAVRLQQNPALNELDTWRFVMEALCQSIYWELQ